MGNTSYINCTLCARPVQLFVFILTGTTKLVLLFCAYYDLGHITVCFDDGVPAHRLSGIRRGRPLTGFAASYILL